MEIRVLNFGLGMRPVISPTYLWELEGIKTCES